MAGSSSTVTYDEGVDRFGTHNRVRRVTIDWVSDDSDGHCTITLDKIVGELVKGVTVPSDSAAPSDNYDIAITDDNSVDVLAACQSTLADRDASSNEEAYFLVLDAAGTPLAQSIHPVVCGRLTVSVTNAGNSKAGTIVLYYKP